MVILVDHTWIVHGNWLVSIIHAFNVRYMIISSQIRWSEGARLVEIHLVVLIHLISWHTTTHIVSNVNWSLVWEHQSSLPIICKWIFRIITESIEWQLHFGGHN